MGGSSKQTIGYWFYWAMCFGWCKGPVDALLEFRAGDKTAWQGRLTSSGRISINKPNLWGGEDNTGGGSGGVVGDMDVMFGEADQAPNDYLISTFGPQQSARRGKFCTVFRGGKFGAFVANPKPVSAKVERILADWQDDMPWYPEKAIVQMAGPSVGELGAESVGWRYLNVASGDTGDYSSPSIDDGAWAVGQTPFASEAGHPYAAAGGFPAIKNTDWPVLTKMWLRRTFVLSSATTFTLQLFVDDFATVWINGTKVLDRVGPNDGLPSAEAFQHNIEISADLLSAGVNHISALVEDTVPAGHMYSYAAFRIVAVSSPLNAMNPAHLLYDSLTHADLQGEPTGAISDDSFRFAADKLYNEGFGLCTDYDSSQETPKQFQQRICNVIGASLSQSRVDGLYYLDLIRGDYALDSLPIIGEDDIISFSQDPSVITETGNKLSAEWFDPQAKETRTTAPVFSMGNVRSAGRVIPAETKKYPEIPVEGLALRIASRDLKSTAVPLSKFDLSTRATLRALRPGMNARLQMPSEGIADMVVVIGSVAHGTSTKGDMKIVAVQNVYSMPETVYVKPQDGLWSPPTTIPVASPHQLSFEAPYVELASSLSNADLSALAGDAGYLLTVATRPPAGVNYAIDTAAAGEEYADRGIGDWSPTATINEAAGYLSEDFTLSAGELLDRVAVGSWAWWDGEIVRVDMVGVDTGTITLGRGCADTVPIKHDASSRIYFCGDWVGSDRREYVGGDLVATKLLTRTGSASMEPGDAAELQVTFADRQVRPYPPGQVRINGLADPSSIVGAITVAGVHRDRVQQADQLVDSEMAAIGPEAGTTYTARYYLNSALVQTDTGLVVPASTYTPGGAGIMRVEFESVRDGLASYQMHVREFAVGQPLLDEAGDLITTEDDQLIIMG